MPRRASVRQPKSQKPLPSHPGALRGTAMWLQPSASHPRETKSAIGPMTSWGEGAISRKLSTRWK